MIRQILGVVPRVLGYFEIWPPGFTTYSVLVPAFMDIPRCDLGRGISPDLRSLVTYVSSRSYGCGYCSAHAAGLGTVFRGAGGSLERNREAMNPEACDLFSPADRVAIDFANAIAEMPSGIREEHRVAVAQHFSEDHEESIVLAATCMGFLNSCMDIFGMVLERRLLHQAQEYLGSSGWEAGNKYDEAYDRELVDADPDEDVKLGALGMARSMVGLIAFDRKALANIEGRPAKLEAQLHKELGFVPSYIRRTTRVPVKRVWAHMLIERLCGTQGTVDPRQKLIMCFVSAKLFDDRLLAAQFAHLATRAGAAPKELRAALITGRCEDARAEVGYALARASTKGPVTLRLQLIEALMEHYTPAEIIELVIAVSIVTMLRRYSAFYPEDHYEDAVANFVAEHGQHIGLSTKPGQTGRSWDEIAFKHRLSAA